MENYERYVIKTIVFAVMLVVMLGLAAGAGAACNHANSYTVLVQSATCCEPGWYDLVCSDCGATVQEKYNEMPATGRHDDMQVQVKSPLCETDGEARFYCNVSGKLVKTEKIDKLGHKNLHRARDDSSAVHPLPQDQRRCHGAGHRPSV